MTGESSRIPILGNRGFFEKSTMAEHEIWGARGFRDDERIEFLSPATHRALSIYEIDPCANIRFIDMETSDGAKLGRPPKRALAGF